MTGQDVGGDAARRHKLSRYREVLADELALQIPSSSVSDSEYIAILAMIAERAPAWVPIEVGSRRKLRDLGLLGSAIMSCGTLAAALDIWIRFASVFGEPVSFRSTLGAELSESLWRLSFAPLPFLAGGVARLCGDELCAAFFSLAREIADHGFHDVRAELQCQRNPDIDYSRYFPGVVTFGNVEAAIVAPASLLDLPIRTHDPDALNLLIAHFRSAEDGDDPLRLGRTGTMVQHYLLRSITTRPTIDAASAGLGLTRRTLFRRLAMEGTSFGEILSDYRRRYAMALVEDGTLKPKQIAHLLGFRSENSLRRAFTQWTGQPIGRWHTDRIHEKSAERQEREKDDGRASTRRIRH